MRLAVILAGVLPRRFIFCLADLLARMGYVLFSGFRARSTKNLTIALGDVLSPSEIRAIVQRSLKNFFYSFAEIPLGLATPPGMVRDEISFVGKEHLDAALAKGRGVILLSGHLGNFLLLGSRLALSGYRTHVLVNQPAGGRVAQLMDEYRSRVLQTTIAARPRSQALRRLADVLRQNEVVVVIADEYRKGPSGVRVSFFGHPVLARRGPVTLALRTGAAVVPGYMVRGLDGRLSLTLEPELKLVRAQRDKKDIAANTVRITRWIEQAVRRYPDQWNWMTVHWQDGENGVELRKNHRLEQLSH